MPFATDICERLRRKFIRAVVRVGDSREERSEFASAAALYEKAAQIESASEELCRRQTVCYERLDRYADALAAYERCRAALQERMGVASAPKTQELAKQLRQRR